MQQPLPGMLAARQNNFGLLEEVESPVGPKWQKIKQAK